VVAFTLSVGASVSMSSTVQAAETTATYVVTLDPGLDARSMAKKHNVEAVRVFTEAIDGYVANLTSTRAAELAKKPTVQSVVADRTFVLHAIDRPQTIPTGVRRIGGTQSPTARIDGVDERINADIAVMDSGVTPHPDLNVVGGVDCAGAGTWHDGEYHGTHVAGTAAALDNGIGVVGVAPGARVWSVRVSDAKGHIKLSALLCGVDWAARNAGVIDVVNMSLGNRGQDLGNCGVSAKGKVRDPLHFAICSGVSRGVVFTVSAGNDSLDAASKVPAAYDEVITVSAYSDFDGSPGGLAAPDCFGQLLGEEDDTMAFFSNYGPDVDIAAPGVCIDSTIPGGYGAISGTSMAAPHVAGAAALIKDRDSTATPTQVKAQLLRTAEPGPLAQDPDTFPEPLLSARTL
jgi:subtilisin family serine protease